MVMKTDEYLVKVGTFEWRGAIYMSVRGLNWCDRVNFHLNLTICNACLKYSSVTSKYTQNLSYTTETSKSSVSETRFDH